MSLREAFEKNPDRRYIMFGGTGGLGKTTFSAATAYWLAKQGDKVLVFSVDPQASLSDIFQRDIFGKGAVEIMPNLYAKEIDADRRIKEYQEEIRQKIRDMYGIDEIPEEIENYIQAATTEFGSFTQAKHAIGQIGRAVYQYDGVEKLTLPQKRRTKKAPPAKTRGAAKTRQRRG